MFAGHYRSSLWIIWQLSGLDSRLTRKLEQKNKKKEKTKDEKETKKRIFFFRDAHSFYDSKEPLCEFSWVSRITRGKMVLFLGENGLCRERERETERKRERALISSECFSNSKRIICRQSEIEKLFSFTFLSTVYHNKVSELDLKWWRQQ